MLTRAEIHYAFQVCRLIEFCSQTDLSGERRHQINPDGTVQKSYGFL